jgi:hypothetical protein
MEEKKKRAEIRVLHNKLVWNARSMGIMSSVGHSPPLHNDMQRCVERFLIGKWHIRIIAGGGLTGDRS